MRYRTTNVTSSTWCPLQGSSWYQLYTCIYTRENPYSIESLYFIECMPFIKLYRLTCSSLPSSHSVWKLISWVGFWCFSTIMARSSRKSYCKISHPIVASSLRYAIYGWMWPGKFKSRSKFDIRKKFTIKYNWHQICCIFKWKTDRSAHG